MSNNSQEIVYISSSDYSDEDVSVPKIEKIVNQRLTSAKRLQFLVKRQNCPETWELASSLTNESKHIREYLNSIPALKKNVDTQTENATVVSSEEILIPINDIDISSTNDTPTSIYQVSQGNVYYKTENGTQKSLSIQLFTDRYPSLLADFFYTRYKDAALRNGPR
ncbi:hypothetical protein TVAG_459070 [Trichomonas vaginalis G3]|uniref:Chromo domain-containing protein n=1 Tax=Trichomonas vaginalis (strain ATCC PRA-98 / G3) TaxID=412133 RepID=A2E6B2_TRIV3|nr:hypothetical protein TVAGG3_0394720 [Trichomonas vaginalis G3]EAY11835.1 hypothetical protein TVAG_459070 [Trichomonas vaginalis G3]KAI5534253.1 hypothetical protein TVAGG3_0394720 [Trichomonas vaginalis G3]|eukprot:XP_001324058.1 hypothetical protein [Trichomonas vaginalis G3]